MKPELGTSPCFSPEAVPAATPVSSSASPSAWTGAMEGISNGLRHLRSCPNYNPCVPGSKTCSCCLPFGCCFYKSHPKLTNSPCHEPESRVQQTPLSSHRQSHSCGSRNQLQTLPAVIICAGSMLELCCWCGACGVTSFLFLPIAG